MESLVQKSGLVALLESNAEDKEIVQFFIETVVDSLAGVKSTKEALQLSSSVQDFLADYDLNPEEDQVLSLCTKLIQDYLATSKSTPKQPPAPPSNKKGQTKGAKEDDDKPAQKGKPPKQDDQPGKKGKKNEVPIVEDKESDDDDEEEDAPVGKSQKKKGKGSKVTDDEPPQKSKSQKKEDVSKKGKKDVVDDEENDDEVEEEDAPVGKGQKKKGKGSKVTDDEPPQKGQKKNQKRAEDQEEDEEQESTKGQKKKGKGGKGKEVKEEESVSKKGVHDNCSSLTNQGQKKGPSKQLDDEESEVVEDEEEDSGRGQKKKGKGGKGNKEEEPASKKGQKKGQSKHADEEEEPEAAQDEEDTSGKGQKKKGKGGKAKEVKEEEPPSKKGMRDSLFRLMNQGQKKGPSKQLDDEEEDSVQDQKKKTPAKGSSKKNQKQEVNDEESEDAAQDSKKKAKGTKEEPAKKGAKKNQKPEEEDLEETVESKKKGKVIKEEGQPKKGSPAVTKKVITQEEESDEEESDAKPSKKKNKQGPQRPQLKMDSRNDDEFEESDRSEESEEEQEENNEQEDEEDEEDEEMNAKEEAERLKQEEERKHAEAEAERVKKEQEEAERIRKEAEEAEKAKEPKETRKDRKKREKDEAEKKKVEAEQQALEQRDAKLFQFEEKKGSESMSKDINIEKFDIAFGSKVLFKDATLKLAHGRKYGLVAPNGTGKSTLLKAIALRENEFVGIPKHFDIHYVEQEIIGDDTPAIQAVVAADVERTYLLELEQRLEASDEADAGEKLQQVHNRLDEIEAYSAEARASSILTGLQFTEDMKKKPTKDFSGGWRMRISLARALFRRPTLLLLDEPTNHLDLLAVIWLETYLLRWKNTLLVVSHDQGFLDSICTDVIHLWEQKLNYYKGNYSNFKFAFQENLALQKKAYEKQVKIIQQVKIQKGKKDEKTKAMDKAKDKARSLRQKHDKSSKDKKDEEKTKDLEVIKKVPRDYTVVFEFPDPEQLSIPIIQVNDASFGYDPNNLIFTDLNFGIDMESRIALVGPNGAGKSTLLKLLTGELQPTSGTVQRNRKLVIGRFTQHFVDKLDMKMTPVEYLESQFPGEFKPDELRPKLGRFGLTGVTHLQPITSLSGGQKSRVVMTEICMRNPHLLFLDEPTNHLDIESVDALAEALNEFKGGIVLVSHDARLIQQVCSDIWVVGDNTVTIYDGDFEDYRAELVAEFEAKETKEEEERNRKDEEQRKVREEKAKVLEEQREQKRKAAIQNT